MPHSVGCSARNPERELIAKRYLRHQRSLADAALAQLLRDEEPPLPEPALGSPHVETVTLFRPVGPAELRLVEGTEFRRFPPRLPEQPIFYPVCNERYAVEIAERWNARDDGGGFVTRFAVRADHLAAHDRHVVGARHHTPAAPSAAST